MDISRINKNIQSAGFYSCTVHFLRFWRNNKYDTLCWFDVGKKVRCNGCAGPRFQVCENEIYIVLIIFTLKTHTSRKHEVDSR
jgi:hypothetical protein